MKDIVLKTGSNGMKAWYESMSNGDYPAGPGILTQMEVSAIQKSKFPIKSLEEALKKLRKYGPKDIISDLELAAIMLNNKKFKGVEGKELKYMDGEWTVVDAPVEKTQRVSLKFVTP